uniref:NIN1 (RPN12) binding protein 1-like protein n=1 Tax=Molossus molossus TaxID=27622 RepID=A0A7J8C9P0_MOLMO|nr:NIN1 (RPN12) binding protein 1-like protein [Molossus molossus]
MAPVEHVVADAGAFLRDAALQDIGKNIYTIRDVVSEIRDKATRRRLAVLPYELRFKDPFPEYVRLGELLCPGVDGEAGSQGADGTGSGASWGLPNLSVVGLET